MLLYIALLHTFVLIGGLMAFQMSVQHAFQSPRCIEEQNAVYECYLRPHGLLEQMGHL